MSMGEGEILDKNEGPEPTSTNNSINKTLGITILGVSGVSALIAGIATSYVAKKRSAEFLKELGKEPIPPVVLENPYTLGLRALAWGTVWAVGGCSLIMYGIWKFYGFKDLNDLRTKARRHIKKSTNDSDERTEFENLTDFLNYLNEMSKAKSSSASSKTS